MFLATHACSTCNMCQYFSLFYFSSRFEKAAFSADFYENWNKILILIQIFKGSYQHWYKALLNRQYRWENESTMTWIFLKVIKTLTFNIIYIPVHVQYIWNWLHLYVSTSALEMPLKTLTSSVFVSLYNINNIRGSIRKWINLLVVLLYQMIFYFISSLEL